MSANRRFVEAHQENKLKALFIAWGMDNSRQNEFLVTLKKLEGIQKDLSLSNPNHIAISNEVIKYCSTGSLGSGGSVRLSVNDAKEQYVSIPIYGKLGSDARDLSQQDFKTNFMLNFDSESFLNFDDENMKTRDLKRIQSGNKTVFALMKAIDDTAKAAVDELNKMRYIFTKKDKESKFKNIDIEYKSPFYIRDDESETFSISLKMEREKNASKNTWETTGYPAKKPELKDGNQSYYIKKGNKKEKAYRPLGVLPAYADEDPIPEDVEDKQMYRLHMSRLHLLFGAGTTIEGTFRPDFTFSKGAIRVAFVFCDKVLRVKPRKPGQRANRERDDIYGGSIEDSIDSESDGSEEESEPYAKKTLEEELLCGTD